MMRDLRRPGDTLELAKQRLLSEISRHLAYENKKTSTYALPEAPDSITELEIVRAMQAELHPQAELAQLLAQGLNAEQQQVFEMVQDAYNEHRRAMIFVQVCSLTSSMVSNPSRMTS